MSIQLKLYPIMGKHTLIILITFKQIVLSTFHHRMP